MVYQTLVETMRELFSTPIPEWLPDGEYDARFNIDGSVTILDAANHPRNNVLGCVAIAPKGFSTMVTCPRGCLNDAHGCKARQQRQQEGRPVYGDVGHADTPDAVWTEYAREYADAVLCAGVYIWASMQQHKGDPTWQPDALGGWLAT